MAIAVNISKKDFKKEKVIVPNLINLSLERAKKVMNNAGFKLGDVYYEESHRVINTVLRQKPEVGEKVNLDKTIDVTICRKSYLDWLPAIFHEQKFNGKNFLKDYLWIFQHLLSGVQEKLDNIHTYFHPYYAPSVFLPWLASWMAMVLDENWTEEKKRKLIKNAVEIYKWRGTLRGLKLYLKIITGVEPEIIEHHFPFKDFEIGVGSLVGMDSIIEEKVDLAHCFTVKVPLPVKKVDDYTIKKIHEIIRTEKPAHTKYFLIFAVSEEEKKEKVKEMVIGENEI
jgi:phage tail-like protein